MYRATTILFALCVVLGYSLVASPSYAATRQMKVVQFNYCGANTDTTLVDGVYLSNCGLHGTAPTADLDALQDFKPDVAFIEELCRNQFENLLAQQQASGKWYMYGAFDPISIKAGSPGDHGTCGGTDQHIGNAIFSHTPITDTDSKPLVDGHPQRIMCATLDDAYSTEACVTHIHPIPADGDDDVRKAQINAAKNYALNHSSGPLVLGGDFNERPTDSSLNDVYTSGEDADGTASSGRFQESDQCPGNIRGGYDPASCNRHTHRPYMGSTNYTAKIDYVFGKHAYFKNFSTSVGKPPWSDHAALKVTVTECSTASC